VIGTILNAATVLVGGLVGQFKPNALSAAAQVRLKVFLGMATFAFGFHLLWLSLNGSFLSVLKQFAIAVVAMGLGALLGKLLGLQKASNAIGRYAGQLLSSNSTTKFSDSFVACALVLNANPLGLAGAVTEGALGYAWPLLVKAVMDGVAALSLGASFKWGVAASALPVLAWQGTLSLGAARLEPFLREHALLDPLGACCALLITISALVIFELKKVELANYLPALVLGPLFSWLLR
jgi:uncharacterized membrane protein YqgA involved in biofilm formation